MSLGRGRRRDVELEGWTVGLGDEEVRWRGGERAEEEGPAWEEEGNPLLEDILESY